MSPTMTITIPIISRPTTSCPPGPATAGDSRTAIPIITAGSITKINLPLGADRTAEYYFPRYLAVPPEQMFITTYYNPFETRGQRYIPYCRRGRRPSGGRARPVASAALPVSPYADEPDTPVVKIPASTRAGSSRGRSGR